MRVRGPTIATFLAEAEESLALLGSQLKKSQSEVRLGVSLGRGGERRRRQPQSVAPPALPHGPPARASDDAASGDTKDFPSVSAGKPFELNRAMTLFLEREEDVKEQLAVQAKTLLRVDRRLQALECRVLAPEAGDTSHPHLAHGACNGNAAATSSRDVKDFCEKQFLRLQAETRRHVEDLGKSLRQWLDDTESGLQVVWGQHLMCDKAECTTGIVEAGQIPGQLLESEVVRSPAPLPAEPVPWECSVAEARTELEPCRPQEGSRVDAQEAGVTQLHEMAARVAQQLLAGQDTIARQTSPASMQTPRQGEAQVPWALLEGVNAQEPVGCEGVTTALSPAQMQTAVAAQESPQLAASGDLCPVSLPQTPDNQEPTPACIMPRYKPRIAGAQVGVQDPNALKPPSPSRCSPVVSATRRRSYEAALFAFAPSDSEIGSASNLFRSFKPTQLDSCLQSPASSTPRCVPAATSCTDTGGEQGREAKAVHAKAEETSGEVTAGDVDVAAREEGTAEKEMVDSAIPELHVGLATVAEGSMSQEQGTPLILSPARMTEQPPENILASCPVGASNEEGDKARADTCPAATLHEAEDNGVGEGDLLQQGMGNGSTCSSPVLTARDKEVVEQQNSEEEPEEEKATSVDLAEVEAEAEPERSELAGTSPSNGFRDFAEPEGTVPGKGAALLQPSAQAAVELQAADPNKAGCEVGPEEVLQSSEAERVDSKAHPRGELDGALQSSPAGHTESEASSEAIPPQLEGALRSVPAGPADSEANPTAEPERALQSCPLGRMESEASSEAMPAQSEGTPQSDTVMHPGIAEGYRAELEWVLRSNPPGHMEREASSGAEPEGVLQSELPGPADSAASSEAELEVALPSSPLGQLESEDSWEAEPAQPRGVLQSDPAGQVDSAARSEAEPEGALRWDPASGQAEGAQVEAAAFVEQVGHATDATDPAEPEIREMWRFSEAAAPERNLRSGPDEGREEDAQSLQFGKARGASGPPSEAEAIEDLEAPELGDDCCNRQAEAAQAGLEQAVDAEEAAHATREDSQSSFGPDSLELGHDLPGCESNSDQTEAAGSHTEMCHNPGAGSTFRGDLPLPVLVTPVPATQDEPVEPAEPASLDLWDQLLEALPMATNDPSLPERESDASGGVAAPRAMGSASSSCASSPQSAQPDIAQRFQTRLPAEQEDGFDKPAMAKSLGPVATPRASSCASSPRRSSAVEDGVKARSSDAGGGRNGEGQEANGNEAGAVEPFATASAASSSAPSTCGREDGDESSEAEGLVTGVGVRSELSEAEVDDNSSSSVQSPYNVERKQAIDPKSAGFTVDTAVLASPLASSSAAGVEAPREACLDAIEHVSSVSSF